MLKEGEAESWAPGQLVADHLVPVPPGLSLLRRAGLQRAHGGAVRTLLHTPEPCALLRAVPPGHLPLWAAVPVCCTDPLRLPVPAPWTPHQLSCPRSNLW